MSELRQNIATREWVIIASERAKRPEEFVQPAKERIEDLDRAWREEPAFGGDPQAAARPPAPARGGRHAME